MMGDTTGKVISCRAAVTWAANEPLKIESITVDPPKQGEVRLKVLASGVCRTDQCGLSGQYPDCVFPTILGHEGGCVVESIGEGVISVVPGDHVIPLFTPQCYKCKFCKSKKTNMCSSIRGSQVRGLMPDGTTRFHCNGRELFHFMGVSSFSEYTVCAEISVAKVDVHADLSKVCLLGCGISTGYGAALNTADVEKDSTCAVWGVGAIGLAVIMGCKERGASRIIAIDINYDKEAIAKQFGATEFINPKEHNTSIQNILIERTDGGLDYTFECVGLINTMEAALESCHRGWGVSTIIGVPDAGQKISTSPFQLIRGRVWKGSAFGGWNSRDDVPKLVDSYIQGKLKVDEFVTHNFQLEKLNEAFEVMNSGTCIRAIIHLNEKQ